jgi:hypothetical protein
MFVVVMMLVSCMMLVVEKLHGGGEGVCESMTIV